MESWAASYKFDGWLHLWLYHSDDLEQSYLFWIAKLDGSE